MTDIHLVTRNPGKLRELTVLFPPDIRLHAVDLDITEIQSMDSREIVRDKLAKAYAAVKKPVIVEDVSIELACLNGLPGPYVRAFEDRLGKSALYILTKGFSDRSVTARCTMGYHDGKITHIVDGEMHGQIVAPRGEGGFGFDSVFVANGQTQTNAELSAEEKNKLSHRSAAVKALAKLLGYRLPNHPKDDIITPVSRPEKGKSSQIWRV